MNISHGKAEKICWDYSNGRVLRGFKFPRVSTFQQDTERVEYLCEPILKAPMVSQHKKEYFDGFIQNNYIQLHRCLVCHKN